MRTHLLAQRLVQAGKARGGGGIPLCHGLIKALVDHCLQSLLGRQQDLGWVTSGDGEVKAMGMGKLVLIAQWRMLRTLRMDIKRDSTTDHRASKNIVRCRLIAAVQNCCFSCDMNHVT